MILSYRQLTFEERIVIQRQLTLGLRPGRSLRVSAGRVRPSCGRCGATAGCDCRYGMTMPIAKGAANCRLSNIHTL
jgi:hypothetical protein